MIRKKRRRRREVLLPDRGKRARWFSMPRISRPRDEFEDNLLRRIAATLGWKARRAQGRPTSIRLEELHQLYLFARRVEHKFPSTLPSGFGKDAWVCGKLAQDSGFKRECPRLAKRGKKGLQNLLAEARSLRRSHLQARWEMRSRWRRMKDMPADDFYIPGDVPPWPRYRRTGGG